MLAFASLGQSLLRVLPVVGCPQPCCCPQDPASRLPVADGQRRVLLRHGEGKWLPQQSAACERSGRRAGTETFSLGLLCRAVVYRV